MQIYLVGGAVRDKLLNFPYHEHDWVVVGGSPEQLLELGYRSVGKDFPVFLHPDTKEEYALARLERKTGTGYTGFECFSSPDVTLEEDLERRDLTINAIAEDSEGNLIDPYGGQQDLADRKLRHVSAAFSEDPLRVLRVARFMSRYYHLGFTVAADTITLMRSISDSGELSSLPRERVWKELQRSLGEHNPEQFFLTLQLCGAMTQLLPDLEHNFRATIKTFSHACQQSNELVIRFACLLSAIDEVVCQQLCENIRAPRDYRDLALLVKRNAELSNAAQLNAEQQLTILERVDAFRRPERFAEFLIACKILYNNPENCRQLATALVVCKSVDIRSLAEQFTGNEIAKAIRKSRINAIEALENT